MPMMPRLRRSSTVATPPQVLYTDTPSGPISGGENGLGGYLSIFGLNFGDAPQVFIGGVAVANIRSVGSAKVAGKLAISQITVQVGGLGSPTLGVALPVVVKVGGISSNSDKTFTPCSGRVLFVSLTGNDGTGAVNNIALPWRHLQVESTFSGAYFACAAGDHIVIRGGNWSDTNGWDSTWMRTAQSGNARNGTASAWIHITAYPGPIGGNAIEDVHYTTPAGASGGIQGPWSGIAGTSGEYFSVSNLRMECNAAAASDAAPINLQYTGGHWRIVNNELGPWPVAGVAEAKAGGVTGYGSDVKILGNHIHDIGGTSALENHGIYVETTAEDWEIAFNWIHDITGGSLVQFHDSVGGAGSITKPHGGIWAGFIGMKVHHNWLENAAKYGIHYADVGSEAGRYEGDNWFNTIIGTHLPPLRVNASQPDQALVFRRNTVYNCMTTFSGTGNGYVRNEGVGSSSGTIRNQFNANVFAVGANTVSGTNWFHDAGTPSATPTTYSFVGNTYYANGTGIAAMTDDSTRIVNAGSMPLGLLTVPLDVA